VRSAVHLEHGGRWSEADIGTKPSAGDAESKPVQIAYGAVLLEISAMDLRLPFDS